MLERHTRDLSILFLGDIAIAALSLWLALYVRRFEIPTLASYAEHLAVFGILILLSCVVFVAVGLYDRTVALFERSLPVTVFEAQSVNAVLAVLFFFFAPVAIQPKTILVLYFVISTLLIIVWRLGIFRIRTLTRPTMPAVIVGRGDEIDAIAAALSEPPFVQLSCGARIDVDKEDAFLVRHVLDTARTVRALYVVADEQFSARIRPELPREMRIIDAAALFEERTSRAPLSLIDAETFRAASHSRANVLYDALKRAMDIGAAVILGSVSLLVYPVVWLAVYLEDRGPLFVRQERVGQGGVVFPMYKFRSMTGNDSGAYGESGKTQLRVTRVGAFLRKSRIDELPQLWSVLLGYQSLIGPRPELPPLVAEYRTRIPLYDLRHLVKPGLSGWAQVYHQAHPHHGADVEETERKLSYDLYYVKHRSLFLDLDIALKTIKTLALRVGA